jgi:16S rRNA (adenine1518-N6/adenine1519-N6)-dimethyltransferase
MKHIHNGVFSGGRVAAKRSLGQNFLTDKGKAEKIAMLMEAHTGDQILEIGPGCGDLTKYLLQTKAHVHAIELDPRALEVLDDELGSHPLLTLEHGDFLKFPLKEYAQKFIVEENEIYKPTLKVAGNIPYYITSEILFRLFEQADVLERAVIMMQKEVAERICAQPRTKEYGILSIAARFVSKPSIALKVPAGCFTPKPSVDSSVVVFDFTKRSVDIDQYKRIQPLVRAAFGQRRKMLSNALKSYTQSIEQEVPDSIKAMLQRRAEELLPADFVILADILIPIKK